MDTKTPSSEATSSTKKVSAQERSDTQHHLHVAQPHAFQVAGNNRITGFEPAIHGVFEGIRDTRDADAPFTRLNAGPVEGRHAEFRCAGVGRSKVCRGQFLCRQFAEIPAEHIDDTAFAVRVAQLEPGQGADHTAALEKIRQIVGRPNGKGAQAKVTDAQHPERTGANGHSQQRIDQ